MRGAGALRVEGRRPEVAAARFMVACGGTLFIERERKRDALRVVHQVADALRAGASVAVFPEGTTVPGRCCCRSMPTCCRPRFRPERRCSRSSSLRRQQRRFSAAPL
jgi:1-acyl-sn-glycerol-3-phosphate acyltransferase